MNQKKEWPEAIRQTAANDPSRRCEMFKKVAALLRAWEATKSENNELWELIAGYGPDGVTPAEMARETGMSGPNISPKLKAWKSLKLVDFRQDGHFKKFFINLDTLKRLTDFENYMLDLGGSTISEVIEECQAMGLPINFVIYTRLYDKEKTVTELMESLGTTEHQPQISAALSRLSDLGIVTKEVDKNFRRYRVSGPVTFLTLGAMDNFVGTGIISLGEPEMV